MKPLITVVIPVYQVEDYITECIQSILHQTFTDFEVILVNDGTQDNSIEVALTSIDNDKRFRVIHQQNKGPGVARNTGINHAQGKYICFVDSDDFIDNNYLKYMYDKLQLTKGNICHCNVALYKNKIEVKHLPFDYSTDKPITTIRNILLGWTGASCCNALYHIKLFKKLRWPSELYEDIIINMAITLENNNVPITCIKQPLYYYRQRPNSITQQNNSQQIKDILKNSVLEPKKLLIEKGAYSQLKREFSIHVTLFFIVMVFKSAQHSTTFRQDCRYLKNYFTNHNFGKELRPLHALKNMLLIKHSKLTDYIKVPLIINLAKCGMVGQRMIKWIVKSRS